MFVKEDLEMLKVVQNDVDLDEEQRPAENRSDHIGSRNDETSAQHIEQQQSQDQPLSKRVCLNESKNSCSKISEFSTLGMTTKYATQPNENRMAIDSDGISSVSIMCMNEMGAANSSTSSSKRDEMLSVPEDAVPSLECTTCEMPAPAPPPTLSWQTLNEDCLNHIVQYLNVFDLLNLKQTCSGLQTFVENILRTRKIKRIEIDLYKENRIKLHLDDAYLTVSTLTSLLEGIKYFGSSVEDFNFGCFCGESRIWHTVVKVLKHCEHLKTLKVYYFDFSCDQVRELEALIGSLLNLKVLKFVFCTGVTNMWPETLKRNSTINKLVLKLYEYTDTNIVTDKFLTYFTNLRGLTIRLNKNNGLLGRILVLGRQNPKMFRINIYEIGTHAPESTEQLRRMRRQQIASTDEEELTNEPQLKVVSLINCVSVERILRKHSEIMEYLDIYGGEYTSKANTEPPLIFNRLQRIKYVAVNTILKELTRAQMPLLKTLKIRLFSTEDLHVLLRFLESKTTLTTIRLKIAPTNPIPNAFWNELIAILQKQCYPKREFLNIFISSYPIGKEVVR